MGGPRRPVKASSRRDRWAVREGFLRQKRTPELRPQRVRQGNAKVWRCRGQNTEEMEVTSLNSRGEHQIGHTLSLSGAGVRRVGWVEWAG